MINLLWGNSLATGGISASSIDSTEGNIVDAAFLEKCSIHVHVNNGSSWAGRIYLVGSGKTDGFYTEDWHVLTPSAALGGTISSNKVEVSGSGRATAIGFWDRLPRSLRVVWEKTSGSDSGTPAVQAILYGFKG